MWLRPTAFSCSDYSLAFSNLCAISQGTTFPRLLCSPVSRLIQPMASTNGSLEKGKRREARVFFPIPLSASCGVSGNSCVSRGSCICSTGPCSMVPTPIRQPYGVLDSITWLPLYALAIVPPSPVAPPVEQLPIFALSYLVLPYHVTNSLY